MFSVRFDSRQGRLLVERSGFLELEEARRFHTAIRGGLAEVTRMGAAFDILIDNSAGLPLASDVATYFESIAAEIRSSSARRVALVSPGGVNRIQAKRILQPGSDDRIGAFEDAAAAEQWLIGAQVLRSAADR